MRVPDEPLRLRRRFRAGDGDAPLSTHSDSRCAPRRHALSAIVVATCAVCMHTRKGMHTGFGAVFSASCPVSAFHWPSARAANTGIPTGRVLPAVGLFRSDDMRLAV